MEKKMEKIAFEGRTKEELMAAVAQWLALQLAGKGKPQPDVEPQHGGGGGP
jgi:hypothetical protein